MTPSIKTYYDELAPTYDQNRFGNTYGQYLHRQESALLDRYLCVPDGRAVLDLACGTGRFLTYCTDGLDISAPMIAAAQAKHPGKALRVGNALATPYEQLSFDAVICFHLLMHLEETDLREFLGEAYRILNPGGLLIFDVPSAERRGLLGRQQAGWHGANAYTDAEVRDTLGTSWRVQEVRGIAALPVHRIPVRLRPLMVGVDSLICRSPLRHLASYRTYVIEKV